MVRLIEVRQPREHDLIDRDFALAGFGTGFEATVTWQILDEDGDTLGEGGVQGVGSNGELHDFADRVSLPDTVNARGAQVVLQVFGDDLSGQHPPGPDLNQVRLTLFTGLRAWRLYEVVRGDTVSAIARDQGQNTTVADIFEANRDTLTDPNKIFPGQILRIPLL